jgi:serine protease Do
VILERFIQMAFQVRFLAAAAIAALPLAGMPGPALSDPVSIAAPQVPSFADVVEAVTPAVVSVKVESQLGATRPRGYRFDRRLQDEDDFFGEQPFFRNGPDDDDDSAQVMRERNGANRAHRFGMNQGSGFFVSQDGYVVTNHHVVENGSKFTVVLDDGSELEATLVGADVRTDLAVLKVQPQRPFTYVKFSQDKVRVGEWVVAVGNPFGLGGTVTAGIVSAHNRALGSSRLDDLLQIDAAVNKGHSGGPAFNLKGEVIGVSNQIFARGGNLGIGFAIPAATASQVVDDLIANGQVVRGWLGVQIQPVTPEIARSVGLDNPSGAIVTTPQPESPAAKAGIAAGDIITSVDGQAIENPRMLARAIAAFRPDSKVSIGIWRNGDASQIEVTVGRLEEPAAAPATRSGRADGATTPQPEGAVRLGLELQPAPGGEGVAVANVLPGSIAARSDLRAGDLIVTVNGQPVTDGDEMLRVLDEAGQGDRPSTLIQIRRGGQLRFIAVPLERG